MLDYSYRNLVIISLLGCSIPFSFILLLLFPDGNVSIAVSPWRRTSKPQRLSNCLFFYFCRYVFIFVYHHNALKNINCNNCSWWGIVKKDDPLFTLLIVAEIDEHPRAINPSKQV
ncbi:hypothetical protein SEVIR_3G388502v4 [Setaria viridis]